MSDPARIPDVMLERYRLNELPPAEQAAIDRLAVADAAVGGRLLALQQSDDDIRRGFPSATLASGITARLAQQGDGPSPVLTILRWAVPVTAAALLALVLVRPAAFGPGVATNPPAAEDGVRVKGVEAALAIYRRTDAGSELLPDGARAQAGDLLRIGYKVAGSAFGVILSVDGRGLVTMHLPAEGGRAVPLDSGNTVLLDRAYELDDAPKWERFYLVTGRTAFDVEPVFTAIRQAIPTGDSPTLSLSPDLGAVTFVIQKDTRP
jgi:hypothetical protein